MLTTTTMFQGNLTADPKLRYTNVSRGFAISEAPLGGN
jgi:single-stranded DNA-binding protein